VSWTPNSARPGRRSRAATPPGRATPRGPEPPAGVSHQAAALPVSRAAGDAFASGSDTVPVPQGATATATCGLSGPVWSGWFTSHTRNFFTWADAHFEATMNSARDITRLQHELDQQQSA
jgi:hypothetical protein